MNPRLALLALSLPFLVGAAGAPPRFNAVLKTDNHWRFTLISSDGRVSSWLRLGQTFDGYRLQTYDPKAQVLELEGNDAGVHLHLVPDAPTIAASGESPGSAEAEAPLTERMRFERFIDKAVAESRNVQLTRIDLLLAELNRANVETQGMDALKRRLIAEMIEVFHDPDIRDMVEQSYIALFSEEELLALAGIHGYSHLQMPADAREDPFSSHKGPQHHAFDQAPLGRKWRAVQPELRERIDSAVASRIKSTMEKLHRIAQDELRNM